MFKWAVPINVDLGAVTNLNRIAVNLADECPASCEAQISAYGEHVDGAETWYLFTHTTQDDILPTSAVNSGLFMNDTGGGPNQAAIGPFMMAVDSNQDFHVRRSAGSALTDVDCTVHGWRDPGIVA